jgi:hypothetical protein
LHITFTAMPCWTINSTNLSNYIKLNKMEETSKTNETAQLGIGGVSGSYLWIPVTERLPETED